MKTSYRSFSEALTANPASETRIARHQITDHNEALPRPDTGYDLKELEARYYQLKNAHKSVEKDLVRFKNELNLARAKAHAHRLADRTPLDPEREAKLEAIIRQRGYQHQQIQLEESQLRRLINEEKAKLHNWDDGRMFIECARELLSDERFAAIWRRVMLKRNGTE